MRTREDIENLFQSIVSALLPKMNPKLIRPAYQNDDSAGKPVLCEDGTYKYVGLTAEENYIYIRAHQVPQGTQPVVYEDGRIETIITYPIQISVYGDQSSNIALCVFSMLRSQAVLQMLESNGLSLVTMSDDITDMHEILNAEWVHRCDFEYTIQEVINIPTPKFVKEAASPTNIAKLTDVSVIVEGE